AALLARWPVDQPLAVLWSGRPGRRRVTLARPERWILPASLAELQHAWRQAQAEGAMLAGFLSYELGRRLEPAAAGDSGHPGAGPGPGWPLIAFARCRQWGTVTADGRWDGPLDPADLPLEPAPGPAAGPKPGPGGRPPADFALGPLRSSAG